MHDPKALDYFFAVTLQQFSFWTEQKDRYHQPLLAPLGGVMQKGAFYLFAAYSRQLESDADFFSPERQANLSRKELLDVFRSDDGLDPMPALDLHLELAQQYGRALRHQRCVAAGRVHIEPRAAPGEQYAVEPQ